jgi:endoglucanase
MLKQFWRQKLGWQWTTVWRHLVLVLLIATLTACQWPARLRPSLSPATPNGADLETTLRDRPAILQASWQAYRDRFIQPDGRVIDWESDQRTTSEGQAYALLRSVFVDDAATFASVLNWSQANLARKQSGQKRLQDQLWIWQWGRQSNGQWGAIDGNFASDADIDACYALILAAKRWERPDYLKLARMKLADLWQHSTLEIQGDRYLLPGPKLAFARPDVATFNPSYFAPYAFRLFAQVDADRDWLQLVNSSYQLLERSSQLSKVGLPSDWIGVEIKTGQPVALSKPVLSQYGFDASRVWWRVSLDADIYNEPRAKAYLKRQLIHLRQLWQQGQKIPAQIDLEGNALVEYDATSQYGMLYHAFRTFDPSLAQQIYQQKLASRYQNGFWDNSSAYYTQNLVWFGLLSPTVFTEALKGVFNLSAQFGHNAAT